MADLTVNSVVDTFMQATTKAGMRTAAGVDVHGADIASAGTINLDTATGDVVDVTGTTTITAVTLAEGQKRVVRFTGALALTHGASLVLPGAANIKTAAGDYAIFVGYAAGVVRALYFRGDGSPVAITDPGVAFIRTGGSDSTGVIGNPNRPFATAAAARALGASRFFVGENTNAGDIECGNTQAEIVYVAGCGPTSIIGAIRNRAHHLTVIDYRGRSVKIGFIDTTSPTDNAGNITVQDIWQSPDGLVHVNGITASEKDYPEEEEGEEGYTSGSITIKGFCWIEGPLVTKGGDGGPSDDGTGPVPSGDGTDGGNITVEGPSILSSAIGPDFRGGGHGEDVGGGEGSDGSAGVLTLRSGANLATAGDPDTAVVRGAVVEDAFYANTYP